MGFFDDLAMGLGFKERTQDYDARTARGVAVDQAVAQNADAAARFRAGEEKLIGFFVGQVMKTTKGKANPQVVNELLRKKLSG